MMTRVLIYLAEAEAVREDVFDMVENPEVRLGFAPSLPPKEIRTPEFGYAPSQDKVFFSCLHSILIYKVYPLLTEADYNNDRKSLYRKLTNRLYLIVKKPRAENAWGFPQGGYETADGEDLRKVS
jgi:hypothetical protein